MNPPVGLPRPFAVLVVDDDPDCAESLALVLRLNGFDVRSAYDADAALAQVNGWQPQAVLLDLAMPGTDGYVLADHIRRETHGRPVLLAVTGHGTRDDRDRSKAAGFDHHLLKPVEPQLLCDLLRGYATGQIGPDTMPAAERRTRR